MDETGVTIVVAKLQPDPARIALRPDARQGASDDAPPGLFLVQHVELAIAGELLDLARFLQMLFVTHRPVTLAEAAEHYQGRL